MKTLLVCIIYFVYVKKLLTTCFIDLFEDFIMPVPKRKRSHARKSKRNANKFFAVKAFTTCPNCKATIAPHQACKECGHYKGVKVLVTKAERSLVRGKARKAKVERQQELQAQQEQQASGSNG